MPAPEAFPRNQDGRPALGHVNLMLDTFLCNASIEDLRAAVRGLLSSGSPGIASAFTTAARTQLQKTSNTSVLQSPMPIFAISSQTASWQPTKRLADMLMRARSLYGVGMAFSSLDILAAIVRAASELRWPSDGEMADTLAMIDADIAQALQSCKEETEAGRVEDIRLARESITKLRIAVEECHKQVEAWGGEIPFERSSSSLELMKL
ncbi:hypothetical protein PC9H_011869 [Pleurotus ostreatus]|uniref:Uncharacterized protein n=1 Tax=Pleurotus ostreatus TaxID=5322 RepID=A0A8H7DN73_PLEOS|nr:uncharacterized protein PC9H_011869 [Pleurotus ostreatus]KAF7421346.1 hypothetical protein PC9H_011869 [Pleurotus ostreatus]